MTVEPCSHSFHISGYDKVFSRCPMCARMNAAASPAAAAALEEDNEDWTPISLEDEQKNRMIELLKVGARPTVVSIDELKAAVMLFLNHRYVMPAPAAVSLNELNRRFGVTAKKLGLTCRDMVIQLTQDGLTAVDTHKGSIVVLPAKAHKEYLTPFADDGDLTARLEREVFQRAFPGQRKGETK